MLNLDAVSPGYPIPDYLYEGQEVYTSLDLETIVKGKVIVAAGDAAKLELKDGTVTRWIDRYKLRIKTPVVPSKP